MNVRVTEREVARAGEGKPYVVYLVETEVYPGGGWVELTRTTYPTGADYIRRSIECYEKHREEEN